MLCIRLLRRSLPAFEALHPGKLNATAGAASYASWHVFCKRRCAAQFNVRPLTPRHTTYADKYYFAPRPPNGTTATTASPGGTDPFLGPYDEIILPAGKAGNFAVRWFTELDTFLFDRRPAPQSPDALPAAAPPANTPVLDRTFPTFDDLGPVLGGNQSVGCMGWSNHYFYPGGVADSVASCQSDGPVNTHGSPPHLSNRYGSPLATDDLLENTEGVLSVLSRGGTLLPSAYADATPFLPRISSRAVMGCVVHPLS